MNTRTHSALGFIAALMLMACGGSDNNDNHNGADASVDGGELHADAGRDAAGDAQADAAADGADAGVDAAVEDASIDASPDADTADAASADGAASADASGDAGRVDTDSDGISDFAEINYYGTDPNDGGSHPSMSVTFETMIAPTSVCSTASLSSGGATGDAYGTVTYTWDFGDGQTATGLGPTHRFSRPGTVRVTLTARDEGELSATFHRDYDVAAVERDTELRFVIHAVDSDVVDYIRSVRVSAPSIGISAPLELFDNGIAGGDLVAGDGDFTNIARVESCATLSTPNNVIITVQDASGRELTLTRTASAFVVD